mmetsp:Transcript_8451/g.9702  ORF Transcript_8451/g.9702 Transcript_8451/m.9702 type:complete len:971 (+) Transcript_8451:2-2914(+)
MTAVRLSPDENHCSIFVVANIMISSSKINNHYNSSSSKSSTSSSSTTTNSNNGSSYISTNTNAITNAPTKYLDSNQNSSGSSIRCSSDATINRNNEENTEVVTEEFATDHDLTTCENEEEKVENDQRDEDNFDDANDVAAEEEEYTDHRVDDNVPLHHILEENHNNNAHNSQMAAMYDDNPVNQEILRGVEIIRHLPMAVCQFDMKGRVMFQNPAAYLPPLDDDEMDEEEEKEDDTESLMDGMDTDDESEFYDQLFEQQYSGVQTLSSNNSKGNFLDRFVNKKVARELLQSLQDEPEQQLPSSVLSTAMSNINATTSLYPTHTTTATVSIEAELHSSEKGRTQWSAIQLRKTKDPVTSRSVILYSAQDKSDAMEAKREREARLQKSEFLAIMAHEIRTPLHQVTGFIDLLELDACNNNTNNNKIAKNSSHNALFPNSIEKLDMQTIVRKCRSTSLINTTTARSSWHSDVTCQTIGNLTDEQRGYIKLLKSSANQLMTVISDVLDYSKLEAGKMKTERIPFELLSVVQGSMEAVRGSCEEKGLTLTLEYGGSDDDDEEGNGNKKIFRRRKSFDGTECYANTARPPRRRKLGRTHSFNNKNKNKSHHLPNIRSNDIPFRIIGDPNRLRQVLLNLLSNAVKFTEKGGIHVQVSSTTRSPKCISNSAVSTAATTTTTNENDALTKTIRSSSSSLSLLEKKEEGNEIIGSNCINGRKNSTFTSDGPRSIKIVVTDTGMGISKENQDTIFEKYQQANLSIARNFGGTGLGLSICKLLVQETMGGSIGVDSDEGWGSSFYVTLPIELPREVIDETTRGVNGDEIFQKSATSMNILVAEDNKINQKLVANMLKRMGHKSTLVENGRQAIDMIEKKHSQQSSTSSGLCYDAVLMDIQMPVMDGLEATRRLRTMGYSDLPILGLTASVKRSDYEELGFDDWLPKPILMKDLKAKLYKLQSEHSEDSDESSNNGLQPPYRR